jgi:hypothetical protein
MRNFSALEIQFIEGKTSDPIIETYKKLYERTPEEFVSSETVRIPVYTPKKFRELARKKLVSLIVAVVLGLLFVYLCATGLAIQSANQNGGGGILPFFLGLISGFAAFMIFIDVYRETLPHISTRSYLSPQTSYSLSTYQPNSKLACSECNGSGTKTIHHEGGGWWGAPKMNPSTGQEESTYHETSPAWDEKVSCPHCHGRKFFDVGEGLKRLNVYLSDFNSKIDVINSKIPEVNNLIMRKNVEIDSYNKRRFKV